MKWLLGGFVLWLVFQGRFAKYAALVASTATAPAQGTATPAPGNAATPAPGFDEGGANPWPSINYGYGPGPIATGPRSSPTGN